MKTTIHYLEHYKGYPTKWQSEKPRCGIESTPSFSSMADEVTCRNCIASLAAQGQLKYLSEREYMTWEMFNQAVRYLATEIRKHPNIKYIYGIPRNGLLLAVALSHQLNLPIITELRTDNGYQLSEVVIVDDISDTGKTLGKYSGILTATLYYKPKTSKKKPDIYAYETDRFVVFPFETNTSAKVDYTKR